VAEAVRTSAPKRAVIAEGHISIATAFALGRAFMVPAGLSLAWNQLPRKELWTLGPPETEPGLVSELTSQDANATALAVLVSVRGNVEPAVVATQSTLPSFRAILRLRPQAGEHVVNITDPGQASAAARLVADEIRRARQVHQVIRTTHLFYSGPVGMAMMIGQQLNALGPVQMYEHHQTPDDAVGTYVPAALLTDPVARSYQGGKRHGTPVVLR
jgi:hypothetical protein